MECKCSLDNNHQIIELCDIKDFNKKIKQFSNKYWTQVTISEKLTTPYDKPCIKNILKIYLDIKITSSKLVKSPLPHKKNFEGLIISGNLLLVSGEIYQNIIYVSNTSSNSIHSYKFDTCFSSYIILEENIDLIHDCFTIYPYVENVFLMPLDKQILSKSLNLFLFAHKISSPITVNNEFVFYQYNDPFPPQNEIVRVGFDGVKKFLIAKSTGITYDSPREDFFLKFELKDGLTKQRKTIGNVPQNENGTDFANNLNNQKFEVGDLISIAYQDNENTFLTNYPITGENFTMNFLANRNFKITRLGIEPCLLPNVLLVKSIENEPVFNLGFDTELGVILIRIPKAVVTNPAFRGQEYFKIVLKNSNLVQKQTASLQGNQEGVPVSIAFANQAFEFGDIIELTYKEGEKVEILNNPYPTSSRHNLANTTSKSFRITTSGLIDI